MDYPPSLMFFGASFMLTSIGFESLAGRFPKWEEAKNTELWGASVEKAEVWRSVGLTI